VNPVLDSFSFRHLLEGDPETGPVGIDDGRLWVWFLVVQRRGPEAGEPVGIGTIEDDLGGGGYGCLLLLNVELVAFRIEHVDEVFAPFFDRP
jgi:hypothetical protein